jgi:hypothetical protein
MVTSKAETLAWCCSGLFLAQIQLGPESAAGETAIGGKLFHQPLAKIGDDPIENPVLGPDALRQRVIPWAINGSESHRPPRLRHPRAEQEGSMPLHPPKNAAVQKRRLGGSARFWSARALPRGLRRGSFSNRKEDEFLAASLGARKIAAGTIDRPAAFDCFTPAGGARWRHVLSGKAI